VACGKQLGCQFRLQIAEEVVVFGGDAPAFERLPIPGGAEAGGDGGDAGDVGAGGGGLQGVFGLFEAQPVTAGQVGAVDGKLHAARGIPFENGFFDKTLIEVAGAPAADGSAAQNAPLRNRQADVHQEGLGAGDGIDGLDVRPGLRRRNSNRNGGGNGQNAGLHRSVFDFEMMSARDQQGEEHQRSGGRSGAGADELAKQVASENTDAQGQEYEGEGHGGAEESFTAKSDQNDEGKDSGKEGGCGERALAHSEIDGHARRDGDTEKEDGTEKPCCGDGGKEKSENAEANTGGYADESADPRRGAIGLAGLQLWLHVRSPNRLGIV
jgi:hypothetical protein